MHEVYRLVSNVVSAVLARNYGDILHLNCMVYELAGEDTAGCWRQPQLVSPIHVFQWLPYTQRLIILGLLDRWWTSLDQIVTHNARHFHACIVPILMLS